MGIQTTTYLVLGLGALTFMESSVELSVLVICAFYIPVVTVGFLSYGDSVRESIINSIQTKWVQQAVNIMITVHCESPSCEPLE